MADKQPQRLTPLINSGGCIVNTTTNAEISHPWFRDMAQRSESQQFTHEK